MLPSILLSFLFRTVFHRAFLTSLSGHHQNLTSIGCGNVLKYLLLGGLHILKKAVCSHCCCCERGTRKNKVKVLYIYNPLLLSLPKCVPQLQNCPILINQQTNACWQFGSFPSTAVRSFHFSPSEPNLFTECDKRPAYCWKLNYIDIIPYEKPHSIAATSLIRSFLPWTMSYKSTQHT